MASGYTPVSVIGYNSSPPPDDGSQVTSNILEWDKHKSKLTDPLKQAIETMDTNIQALDDCTLKVGGSAFSAHKNGTDQTGIASGVWTKITFTTEDFDLANDYDAVNSKWIPEESGKYVLTATLKWDPDGVSGEKTLGISLYKNGSPFKNGLEVSFTDTSGDQKSVNSAWVVNANGNDEFEIYGYQTISASEQVKGDSLVTWFQGVKTG